MKRGITDKIFESELFLKIVLIVLIGVAIWMGYKTFT